MIASLKTDKALLERLEEAAKKRLTRDELRNQRVSFVFGNLPEKSDITRERVAKKIESNEGA